MDRYAKTLQTAQLEAEKEQLESQRLIQAQKDEFSRDTENIENLSGYSEQHAVFALQVYQKKYIENVEIIKKYETDILHMIVEESKKEEAEVLEWLVDAQLQIQLYKGIVHMPWEK